MVRFSVVYDPPTFDPFRAIDEMMGDVPDYHFPAPDGPIARRIEANREAIWRAWTQLAFAVEVLDFDMDAPR